MNKISIKDVMSYSPEQIWSLPPGKYTLVFDDNKLVKTTRRRLILNRYLWLMFDGLPETVHITYECSIDYILGDDGTLDVNTHDRCLNNIFKYICNELGIRYYHQKEEFLRRSVEIVSRIFNEVILNIGEYATTIKAPDFVSILKVPEIQAIHERTVNHPDSVDKAHKDLVEWLTTSKMKHPLVLANRAKAVRTSQFNQCIGPRGFVTDLDRTVFGYAIMNGFIRGLHTLYELITESRTAAKALNASDSSIRESEYTSRRFAIIGMVIGSPVPGDCGSQNFRTCVVSKRYLPNMKGKWYKINDDDPLKCIEGNEEELIGQIIKYRHVNGCTHYDRKKVCTVCAGALSENLKEDTNLAAEAVLDFMHDVTQKTLSFKHETKSVSANAVVLGEVAAQYFRPGDENELYIRKEINTSNISLVLNKNGLDKLMDVLTISTLDIPMSNIGEISIVGIVSNDGKINDVATISSDDRKANITRELLEYIKDDNNKFELDNKGNYVIPLANWDKKKPIFTIPLKEADTMAFLRELKKKVESTNKKKMTPDEHFFSLADLVLERANCNFTILEILSYAITAYNIEDGNYRLSRNSPNVQIAQRDDIFRRRSKGQLLPYEKQIQLLTGKPNESFDMRYGESHPLDVQFMPQEILEGK